MSFFAAAVFTVLSAALDAGSPGLAVRWRTPSAGAIAVGTRIAVLEPDLLHVALFDASSGQPLWRTEFQKTATGAHELHRLPGGLLVIAGENLLLLDEATGKVKTRARTGGTGRCFVWERGGAFALRCDCTFQPLDGSTGKALGAAFVGEVVTEKRFDGEGSDTGCRGLDFDVLGRTGALALYTVGDDIHALDATTGKEAWRVKATGLRSTSEWARGISEDGKTFWLGDWYGEVQVFDARGGLLWKRAGPGDYSQRHLAIANKQGLFLSEPGRATQLELRTGKALWKHEIPEGQLALPWQGKVPRDVVVALEGPVTVVWLDGETGKERGRLELKKGEGLSTRADGRYRIGPSFQDPRQVLDGELHPLPEPAPDFRLERADAEVSVLRRWPEGPELARWSEIVDEVAQGKNWIALQRFPGRVPTELFVLGEESSLLTELADLHRALLDDGVDVAKLALRLGPAVKVEGSSPTNNSELTPRARWLTRARVSHYQNGAVFTVDLDLAEPTRPTLAQLREIFGEGTDSRGLHGERRQMFYPERGGPRWKVVVIASLSPCRDPHTDQEWTGGPCLPITPGSSVVQLTFRRDPQ